MLAVAAIMMTSATYAWFTISTNPEVKGVSANVTANGNLEIALDAGSHTKPSESTTADYGKNETWGNMVNTDKFFNGANLTLKPVQCTFSSSIGTYEFSYPVYGNDGRIKELKKLKEVQAADAASGTYADFGGVKVYAESDISSLNSSAVNTNSASIYAFEIDYWLRTNKSSAMLELTSSGVKRDQNNMPTGGGSVLDIDGVSAIMIVSSATSGTVGGTAYYKLVRNSTDNGLSMLEVNADLTAKTGATTKYAMPQNEAVEVRMFVYMDGTSITNKDAKQSLSQFTMNVQFTVGDLTAMNVNPVSGS